MGEWAAKRHSELSSGVGGMADVNYYYDGSSTESEAYDDDEPETPPSSPPPPAASPAPGVAKAAVPDAVVEAMVSAPVSSHNVIDLFALPTLVRPPPPPSPTPIEAQEESDEKPIPASQPSPPVAVADCVDLTKHDAPTTPAIDADAKCGKCSKLMLSEVAILAPRLEDTESVFCHCCGLTLPWFCFTEPQRLAKRPECRGCRGVPTVIGMLTARVRKALGMNTEDLVASRRQPPCELCGLPLVRVTKEQADAPMKLACSCCKRSLALDFYSKNQRTRGDKRRCVGCLGNIGKRPKTAVAAAMKAWQSAHPVDTKAQEEKRLARLQAKKEEKQRKKAEKREIFRNKVARHKFAVRALARKRQDNDLRGSTHIEYLKQLDKEEALLQHAAKRLKSENHAVFNEVMHEKVKHGLDLKDKPSKASKRPQAESNTPQTRNDDYVDGSAAQSHKKLRMYGLVVMTRSQRRAADMEKAKEKAMKKKLKMQMKAEVETKTDMAGEVAGALIDLTDAP